MKRMMHAVHGFTHAENLNDEKRLLAMGWVEDDGKALAAKSVQAPQLPVAEDFAVHVEEIPSVPPQASHQAAAVKPVPSKPKPAAKRAYNRKPKV